MRITFEPIDDDVSEVVIKQMSFRFLLFDLYTIDNTNIYESCISHQQIGISEKKEIVLPFSGQTAEITTVFQSHVL